MSLSQLPNEILLKIFAYIRHPSDDPSSDNTSTNTLLNLSVCSRQLHIATESILYSSFKETSPTSLLSFLRTVLKYPVLAHYVRTYEGLDTRTIWQDATLHYPLAPPSLSQESCDEELENLIYSAIENTSLGMELEDLWKEDGEGYVNGEWDAATALALCVLPNLDTFKVTYSQSRLYVEYNLRAMALDSFQLPWMNKALQRFVYPPPALSIYPEANPGGKPTIENMMVYAPFLTNNGAEPIFPDTTFSLHFAQTSLHKLQISSVSSWVWDFDILDNPILSSTLDLEITNSLLPITSSKDFFSRFPLLQRLIVTSPSDAPLGAAHLVAAIRHLQPHLKELTLHGYSKGSGIRHPNDSLFYFTELEELDITVQHLEAYYPADNPPGDNYQAPYWDFVAARRVSLHPLAPFTEVLPRSLKTLKLRWCEESVVGKVMALLVEQQKDKDSRRLEMIQIEFLTAKGRDDAFDELEDLRAKCRFMGVGLEVGFVYMFPSDVPKEQRLY